MMAFVSYEQYGNYSYGARRNLAKVQAALFDSKVTALPFQRVAHTGTILARMHRRNYYLRPSPRRPPLPPTKQRKGDPPKKSDQQTANWMASQPSPPANRSRNITSLSLSASSPRSGGAPVVSSLWRHCTLFYLRRRYKASIINLSRNCRMMTLLLQFGRSLCQIQRKATKPVT